jgi:uncharacterized protein GlcG (DUF336 family)
MKVSVTVLDGQGMPQNVTVEVPDNATPEEIEKAVEKATRNLCVTG